MIVLETDQMNIRTWQNDDWLLLKPMSNDPDVMRYLGGELLTDEQVQGLSARQAENFESLGYCYWPMELKKTGEFIGLCGVQPKPPDAYDFGWRLAKAFWGFGYTTEAALAIRNYAFTELSLPQLTATARVQNVASITVMKKIGMVYVDTTLTEYGDVVRYVLDNPNQ